MSLAQALRRRLRPPIRAAYHLLYRRMLPIHWWLADRPFKKGAAGQRWPVPPAKLRFRVAECTDAAQFFRVGEEAAANMRAVLAEAGYCIGNFTNVLDFGCGCGRTLMWLLEPFPEVHWHGTDVDAEAVDWCRKNIPNSRFSVNGPLPPLPYPDAAFEFVYAVSVFTHLSEEYQRAWIPELHRILKPGGLLLLTFHGEHVWKALEEAEDVERQGLVFRTSTKLKGVLPDWYQTTFQTSSHMLRSLSRHFTVVKLFNQGLGDHDVVIARRD